MVRNTFSLKAPPPPTADRACIMYWPGRSRISSHAIRRCRVTMLRAVAAGIRTACPWKSRWKRNWALPVKSRSRAMASASSMNCAVNRLLPTFRIGRSSLIVLATGWTSRKLTLRSRTSISRACGGCSRISGSAICFIRATKWFLTARAVARPFPITRWPRVTAKPATPQFLCACRWWMNPALRYWCGRLPPGRCRPMWRWLWAQRSNTSRSRIVYPRAAARS